MQETSLGNIWVRVNVSVIVLYAER